MLNMIKMDLYRMFRTKSLYIIWIVMAAAVLFSTSMSKMDIESMNAEAQQMEHVAQAEEAETVNLGMSVLLPTQPGEKVTVFDQIYANLQSKFIAMFMVIFTVIFASADINSGYIKNIGGQVRDRGKLIFSKAVALFGYTIITMLIYLAVQIAAQRCFFGYLEWGNISDFLQYFGVQVLLHYALMLIGMAIAVVLNSNVFSMAIVVCLCMNMMVIFYGMLDKMIQKAGAQDFHILEHTVTGKITLLTMLPANKECMEAIAIAAAFGIVVTILAGMVFRKRDI